MCGQTKGGGSAVTRSKSKNKDIPLLTREDIPSSVKSKRSASTYNSTTSAYSERHTPSLSNNSSKSTLSDITDETFPSNKRIKVTNPQINSGHTTDRIVSNEVKTQEESPTVGAILIDPHRV